jgi:hypothetical protein
MSHKRHNRVATPMLILAAEDSGNSSTESSGAPGAAVPTDWVKGQLLNVRHGGPGYRVTILGEEYDPRSPERCLEFSNGFECQQFVSDWYQRQSHDPRA